MSGLKTSTISLVLCGVALAASPDYFPLQPGNQWVYRCSGMCGDEAPVIEITQGAVFNGRWYGQLKGFRGGQTWLRLDEDGVLWAYDPATEQESRWYSFFAPEGESFETSVDLCSPVAAVKSRNAEYRGPTGEFRNALEVTYLPGPCADAGLSRELFLPWIGLIQRTENTIAGPRTYDLIYSRTGGVTVVAEPLLSFSLTLDRAAYIADLEPPVDPRRSIPVMTARMTLRNTTDHPVTLKYSSSQRYDLEIRTEKGEVVYRWSEGKGFLMVIGEEAFGPGERNYTVVVRLAGRDGKPLPPGKYVAEARLTTMQPQGFTATVPFEIFYVF